MNFEKYDVGVKSLIEDVETMRKHSDPGLVEAADKLFDEVKDTDDKALLGYAYYAKAEACYIFLPDQEKFKEYALNALKLLKAAGENHFIGKCYNLFGVEALLWGNSILGLDYLINTINISAADSDFYLRGVAESNIAHIYMDLENYNEALSYIDRALKDFKNTPTDPRYVGNMILVLCFKGLSLLSISPDNVDAAQQALNQAYEVRGGMINKYYDMVLYRLEMKVAHYKGDYAWRDAVIEKSMEIVRECAQIADLTEDFCDIGDFLIKICDLKNAKCILDTLKDIEEKNDIINIRLQIIKYAISYYEATGDEHARLAEIVKHYKYSRIQEMINNESISFYMKVRGTMEELRVRQGEIVKENQRLTRRAAYDELTGLPNRYGLNDFSENAFERAYKNNRPLAVEILDIDNFKQFNDTYGHQEGDMVIKQVADVLKKLSEEKEGVFCARYGGDEFVVIYENRTDDEVVILAAELRKMIADLKIPSHDSQVTPYMTVSQGIRNSVPKETNKLWDYMYTADNALYSVKKSTKGEIALLHSALISEKSLKDRKQF